MKIVRLAWVALLAFACLQGRAWADPVTSGCISVTTIRSAQPEFGLPSFWDVHANFGPGPVPSGSYDAYCANRTRQIYPGANYATTVFEFTDLAGITALNLVSLPQNLDLVEWVLNQGLVGLPSSGNGLFTSDDVQAAIWVLLDGANANLGTATSLRDWSQARVDEIVAAANLNGEGFAPECGELKGLLLNPVNGVAQSQNAGCLPVANPLTAPPAFQVLVIAVPADCDDPGPTPLIVQCVSEGAGSVGTPYDASMVATGGLPPYSFTLTAGTLPTGLSLDPVTGSISGVPSMAGTFVFTITVVDSEATGGQQTVSQECSIVIEPGTPETYCVQEAALLNGHPSHALWLPGIGTDYIFGNSPGEFVDNGDGTATLKGTVFSRSKPNEGWEINVTLSGLVLPPAAAPAGSPKLELPASSYVPEGTVDTSTWAYQTELTGTLTGIGDLAGGLINLSRFGPAWQEGVGANGKNHEYGASAWLTLEVVANPPGRTLEPTGHGDFNLNIATECVPPPQECQECDGRVTKLTLRYDGPTGTVKVQSKFGSSTWTIFEQTVASGGQFTVVGNDQHGTLGTDIKLYVNGVFKTEIHTSCSVPIGPGMVFGHFTILEGYSRNGGLLCPVTTPPPPPPPDCGPCDGRVTKLTLRYDGPTGTVKVKSKFGSSTWTIFEQTVASGGQFTVVGNDQHGTLGTDIKLYVNGVFKTEIHTSCSQPIGPGMVFGNFTIIEGYSRNGGKLCGVAPPAPKPVCLVCVSTSSGRVGTAYSSSLRASGGVPPYHYSIVGGSLPPGLILDAGTGLISGTPTLTGTFSFTAKVTDSLGTSGASAATVNCSIRIDPPACPPVSIGCLSAGTAKVGVAYSSSFAVSGGTAPYQFSIVSGSLPPGLTLNTTTGLVSGTPTTSGTYCFTAKVKALGCGVCFTDTVACKIVVSPAASGCVSLVAGDTATIGYWNGPNGQALILSLNGGSSSTQLGNWLASNFPYLYGAYAGSDNLAGKSNYQVAAKFKQFFALKGAKTKAQMLATALAVYVTNSGLAGNTAAASGFNVSAGGTGAKCYNVDGYGSSIGLQNYQNYGIMALLKQADLKKKQGCFSSQAFNAIFDGINRKGDRL